MNIWSLISAVSTVVALLVSIAFPFVYACTAKWYSNPIGRGWMLSSIVIVLLVSKPTVQLITDTATFSSTPYVAVVNFVAAVGLSFMLFTYIGVVRREWRRLDQQKEVK